MNEPISIDALLNTLLSEQILGSNLSDTDKASIQELMQELTGDQQIELNTDIPESTDNLATELDALFTELQPEQPIDVTINKLLHQQSDASLIDLLSHQVEAADDVVEILCYRPISKQAVKELRQVELQLVALSIGVGDLREAVERRTTAQHPNSITWKRRVKSLLLKEFNFLNIWVRRF